MANKITITYLDDVSLTKSEVVDAARSMYGESVHVEVSPMSNDYEDNMIFALDGLLTSQQLDMFFDDSAIYRERLPVLRRSILNKVEVLLNQLIIDNEAKIT